jgi:hypothetical protein
MMASVFHPRVLRGRLLRAAATASRSWRLCLAPRCLGEGIGAAVRWTALCLSSRSGQLFSSRGGLHEAVEASGEDALQAPSDVTVGLALRAAFLLVVAGLFMAAKTCDRHGMKARLRLRSPIRLSRCRVRWPLLASSGAAPARDANAASLRTGPR